MFKTSSVSGWIGSLIACVLGMAAAAEPAEFDFQTGRLIIDEKGYPELRLADGAAWPKPADPIAVLEVEGKILRPESVAVDGNMLSVRFGNGAACSMAVQPGPGYFVFDVKDFAGAEKTDRVQWLSLPVPKDAEVMNTLNAARTETHVVALSAAEVNVHASSQTQGGRAGDRTGCSHEFVQADQAKAGQTAARFTATADAQPGGWSIRGRDFRIPMNLTGCKAIRAWVHGDGKGELLKFQLFDGAGGYRDTYIPITFEGWKQVSIEKAALDTLRYDRVRGLNIYYNGLPPSETVTCLIDQVEAVLDREGVEQSVVLEDFEPPGVLFNIETARVLRLETAAAHGVLPARFGLVVNEQSAFLDTMERFEIAAGLPSPRPGGVWNKRSPWIKRSYLFITRFDESQIDDVIALARRGGFDMILILQSSWTRATGHFEINTDNFPGGLDEFAKAVNRLKDAGFHVGLHLLGASIYPPDPYLTPVPDPRLVKGAVAKLSADIDAAAAIIPTEAAPAGFPGEDGGYRGQGAVLQVGDELIRYGARSMDAPFGFLGCQRGHLGTKAAAHKKGAPVSHLVRAYGYHMHDMDTTLLDEVASHFAKVANACDIDMIYFDGSERLQGDHWYYNALLHKTFYDKLARKDILIQASSFSHYSWHILARSASADGHGDLKGYLDERSGWLDAFKRNAMPLDIGWYYGYDPNCTPDMYEYVLGATIGYGASVSFQVSLDAARAHPFTGDILDLIARYERLRLSGRVDEAMRARLRIDSSLAGEKKPEERAALLDRRREFRLTGAEGNEAFQRVFYDPWHTVTPAEPDSRAWTVRTPAGPAKTGIQIHALPGPWFNPGPSYAAPGAIVLETFDTLAPYTSKGGEVTSIAQGEGGSTLQGVTQQMTLSDQDAKEGGRCAVYSAESTLDTAAGWSYIGKTFSPPVDLSKHKAIGFWLRGDGKGGKFKLQLTDGAKAVDFYITNDYTGWRYQQLLRPANDPIDYSQVRRLNFYYNGLPAKAAVSCAIDDVKALTAIDRRTLTNPWIEIDGKRFPCSCTLEEGQYAFLWPGEPLHCFGAPLAKPTTGSAPATIIELDQGEHAARFGCDGALMGPVRARVTFQSPERYVVGRN